MSSTKVVALQWAMHYLNFISGPEFEPVTEGELRQQLRVDENIETSLLMRLARVSRRVVERYCTAAGRNR
ncbi:MAG: hypothetical protein ACJ713_19080 [Candidatus Sulfotelmatobacter sp.]